jgi:hypothetical protein
MNWTLIVQTVTAGAVVGVLIAMVVAVILSIRHNGRLDAALRHLQEHGTALLAAATQQAEAASRLVEETHEDRAVASMPLLILLDEPPPAIREQPWAAVRARNVGNGPALNFVIWMLTGGTLYRSAGAEANGFSGALHLAPGDVFEPGPSMNMLLVGRAHGYLDPGPAVVGEDPSTNLIAYCADHFGNRYRFNLRTADPPDIWERGADAPAWAGAWDPRLSSTEPPLSARPERDVSDLVAVLRDVLERLEDVAGVESDVRITGRAVHHPHDPQRRSDIEPGTQTGG